MLVLSGLLAASALARPPDITIRAHPEPYTNAVAPLPSGRDALYWVGNRTDFLNRVEITPDALVKSVIASDVYILLHAIDYDGDGVPGLLGRNWDGDLVDFLTGLVVEIDFDCRGHIVPGDVNGDGTEDLITASTAWLGQVGGFRRGAELPPTTDVVCPRLHPVGDLDGDGRGDFVRAEVQEVYPDYYDYDTDGDSLELYLSGEYAEPSWVPRWRIVPTTYGTAPALAAVAADLDGDGVDELITLAGTQTYGAFKGEMQVWTDLLNASGPTLLRRSEPLRQGSRELNGIGLHNLGDLDGDGDDELLVAHDGLNDGAFLRIVDAELDGASLFDRFGEPFDLPFPPGVKEERLRSLEVDVGDFDGDGTKDVAVGMVWKARRHADVRRRGKLAFWLSSPWHGTIEQAGPDDAPDPAEAPAAQGCGCASGGAASAPWLLALVALALSVRRRAA